VKTSGKPLSPLPPHPEQKAGRVLTGPPTRARVIPGCQVATFIRPDGIVRVGWIVRFVCEDGICAVLDGRASDLREDEELFACRTDGTHARDRLLGGGSVGWIGAIDGPGNRFSVSRRPGEPPGTPDGWDGTMYGFRRPE
jgi:hypothetical protein